MNNDSLISTAAAAKILNRSSQNIRFRLDPHSQMIEKGKLKNYYLLSKVISVKREIENETNQRKDSKAYRPRKRIKPSDDPCNVRIDGPPAHRGRVCMFRGCHTPVGTGEAVCLEHRVWYKSRQETYNGMTDHACHI